MSFLDRLFRIQERERQIQESAAVLAKAHLDVAESYAMLQEEWERLARCAQKLDEVLNPAKTETFTEADHHRARGLGVAL